MGYAVRFRRAWQRFSTGVRTAAILIVIAMLGVIGYQLYIFYSDKVGFTPAKAIDTYVDALANGNYAEVYRLTSKTDLTDIYGRRITEGEFIDQLKRLTGEHKLPFSNVEITKVAEREGVRYYDVKLHSVVGGTAGTSRLLIQVRREDKTWVVVYPFAIVL
jgi:hypothetical protein